MIFNGASTRTQQSLAILDASLQAILANCNVVPRGSPEQEWYFHDISSPSRASSLTNIERQLAYLEDMKHQWDPCNIALPEAWLHDLPQDDNFGRQHAGKLRLVISALLQLVINDIRRIPTSEVYERNKNIFSLAPDFCLSVPRARPRSCKFGEHMDLEHSEHCQMVLSSFLDYSGTESSAEFCISNMFTGVPGCWMRRDPSTSFPPVLDVASDVRTRLDFALLLHQYCPFHPTSAERDSFLRISATHPALVLAVKGPVPWIDDLSSQRPGQTMGSILQDLALHAQPSVDLMLATLHLRHQQELGSNGHLGPELPDFACIVGLIFDAEAVSIVAHIPVVPQRHSNTPTAPGAMSGPRYISHIVDTLPFPSRPSPGSTIQEWIVQRLRVATALLTIQRHAHRLSAIWDDVMLPQNIRDGDDALETESAYMGPCVLRSPSIAVNEYAGPVFEIDEEAWQTYLGSEDEEDSDSEAQCALNERVEQWRESIHSDAYTHLDLCSVEFPNALHTDSIQSPCSTPLPEPDVQLFEPFGEDTRGHSTMPFSTIYPWTYPDLTPLAHERWHYGRFLDQSSRSPVSRGISDMCSTLNRIYAFFLPESWVTSDPARYPESAPAWYKPQKRAIHLMRLALVLLHSIEPIPDHEYTVDPPYPEPDVYLNPHRADEDPRSLHRSLGHMFSNATLTSYEMPYATLMTDVLRGFLNIPLCSLTRDTSSSPFGPALVVRATQLSCQIPILVALPWFVQYQHAAHHFATFFDETLSFLVDLFTRDAGDHAGDLNDLIPRWCFLFGVVYSPEGVVMSAHRPEWNAEGQKWHFLTTELSTRYKGSFAVSAVSRGELPATLLVIQRHTAHFKQNLDAYIASKTHRS